MSSFPPSSALDATTQAFPVLTTTQVDRVRTKSRIRKVETGEILFEPGDTDVPFFVLLSGSMEIVQPTFPGEREIAKHGPNEFTGEMTMISGQRCLVLGRVTAPGEFLEISSDGLRSLVAKDSELGEVFIRAFILRRLELINRGYGNIILLGSRHSSNTLHLREFLDRNAYPYSYVDLDIDKTSQELLDRFDIKPDEVPVVLCCGSKTVLRNPSTHELADRLCLSVSVDSSQLRDLVIVGGGPSGLAAAVYGASEGLDTLVIETAAPGGQAGTSSKIENYLGFPTGVSGQELTARALAQAQKFGAKIIVGHSVVRLDCDQRPYRVILDDENEFATRSIIISTGAQYNRPNIVHLDSFEGQGIYYGATYIESQICANEEVVVVGGGNSAGQAAVFLSQSASKVYMLVRSGELSETMSRYLIQRIEDNPRIELHYQTEIVGLEGNRRLERIIWLDGITGEKSVHNVAHVFIMTGAAPKTAWLRGCIALDDKGFVLTGRELDTIAGIPMRPFTWPLGRRPQMLETSLPGVFAIGDVRSGSVKRVASAVGEGAIAVHLVHGILSEPWVTSVADTLV